MLFKKLENYHALVVKLVDTGDLKSPALIGVPVRFRPEAPNLNVLK